MLSIIILYNQLLVSAGEIVYGKLLFISHKPGGGLHNFVRNFTRSCNRDGGGGGGESGSLIKKRFEKRYIAVLIKILFELNRLVELQNVVRIRILFYAA